MTSSYNNKVTFGDILDTITYLKNPIKIIEVGILEGFSLKHFADSCSKDTCIKAYDIFEEFNGNHAKKEQLMEQFKSYDNVSINYGDFYEVHKGISDVDIIHIDIANNGAVYEYAIEHYSPKLNANGILIMEGGSEKRDNVEWMIKYNKPKIQPVLEKYKDQYNIKVIGEFPSITMVTKFNNMKD